MGGNVGKESIVVDIDENKKRPRQEQVIENEINGRLALGSLKTSIEYTISVSAGSFEGARRELLFIQLGTIEAWAILMKCQLIANKRDFIFLSETLVSANKLEEFRLLLNHDSCFCVDRLGRSGGLALFWNNAFSVNMLSYARNVFNSDKDPEIG